MARLAAVALLLALHARAGDVLVNPIVGHEVRLDGGSTPTPKTSNATATALPVVPRVLPREMLPRARVRAGDCQPGEPSAAQCAGLTRQGRGRGL